jgi:hypothetical protein
MPSVPPALAAIVDRCLAKNPAQRYDTSEKLLEALEGYLTNGARGSLPKPRLISDTEAQQVWGRAAELQAQTGIRPRPEPMAIVRDEAADARRSSGHALGDVVEAGREAGIKTQYLEHVLVERGLAQPASRDVKQAVTWWAGSPTQIVEQNETQGELSPAQFDSILNLLRDGTGEAGSITASRRELGWRAEWFGSALTASVVPADGHTSVRLTQRIRGLAAATIASAITIGGMLAPVVTYTSYRILSMPTPRWVRTLGIDLFVQRSDRAAIAVGIGIGAALIAIPIARAINRLFHRQQQRRLHLLAEAVTARVQLAVADDERNK